MYVMTSLSCIVTVYACYYFSTYNWYVIKTLLREILSPYVSDSRASVSCLLAIRKAYLFFICTLKLICKCRFNLVTYVNVTGKGEKLPVFLNPEKKKIQALIWQKLAGML